MLATTRHIVGSRGKSQITCENQCFLVWWEDLYVLLIECTTVRKLEIEVVVTRKGQTTIPVRLRQKYKIGEGTRLQVIETEEGILFKPKKSTLDLAGSGSQYATPKEMKKLLDKLREEDVSNGLRH